MFIPILVAFVDQNDPRDLRILVQSTTPIAGMNEVSCNAFPSASAPHSPFKDIRSNYSISPISGSLSPQGFGAANAGLRGRKDAIGDPFSPPIVPASTWEISIGFETAKNSEVVAQHIATSRYLFLFLHIMLFVYDTYLYLFLLFHTVCRIRVRSARVDNIRAFLTFWGDKDKFM